VQERAAIARLVFAQLGRIDEEAVAGRQQQPHAQAFRRKAIGLQVFDHDRRLGISARKSSPNCSAGWRSRRAWRTRSPASRSGSSHGRRQQHGDVAPLCLFERASTGERSNHVRVMTHALENAILTKSRATPERCAA